MRTNRSIMYRTPKVEEALNKDEESLSDVKRSLKKTNLSIVRQHLFSRDSFDVNQDIDMYSESLDLTGKS